jgi:uncharacterized protein (DUF2336 family)
MSKKSKLKADSAAAASLSLLDELETTLAHGTVARRVETLRRVTDLFLDTAGDYSAAQVGVFDDVYDCLIQSMEASAKVLLAERLAPVPTAPPRIIRTLAFDDLIDVAAPVLSQSERLDDAALMANACTKSQQHLLAISTRKQLSEAVTDVLVERGNDVVIESVVGNPGATFSELGYDRLVTRAKGNDTIACGLGLRPTLPRHHYLKLVARASASVRARLEAANPNASQDVSMAVREVTRRARSEPSEMTPAATIAHSLVKSLYEDGRLDEHQVASFAAANKFDETNAALAALANVSVAMAETVMIEDRAEGVLIVAKVAGLSWSTVKDIIDLRKKFTDAGPLDLEASRKTYERLRLSTAQQALRFHKMREVAAAAAE